MGEQQRALFVVRYLSGERLELKVCVEVHRPLWTLHQDAVVAHFLGGLQHALHQSLLISKEEVPIRDLSSPAVKDHLTSNDPTRFSAEGTLEKHVLRISGSECLPLCISSLSSTAEIWEFSVACRAPSVLNLLNPQSQCQWLSLCVSLPLPPIIFTAAAAAYIICI